MAAGGHATAANSCKPHSRVFKPSPILAAVAAVSPLLATMPPCELECLVRHVPLFKGDVLLELLAGSIESPEAVSRFAKLAAPLPADYSAGQLAQCLLQLGQEMDKVSCSAEHANTKRTTNCSFGLGTNLAAAGFGGGCALNRWLSGRVACRHLVDGTIIA